MPDQAVVSGLPSMLVTELAANPARRSTARASGSSAWSGTRLAAPARVVASTGYRHPRHPAKNGSARRARIAGQPAGDAPEPQPTPTKGDICARGLDAASPVAQIDARERQPRQARQQARPTGTPARIFAQCPAGPGDQGALTPSPRDPGTTVRPRVPGSGWPRCGRRCWHPRRAPSPAGC